MTLRTCRTCGLAEIRTEDAFKRAQTNLCPITQQCVTCLIRAAASAKGMPPAVDEPFDARAAAARNDA